MVEFFLDTNYFLNDKSILLVVLDRRQVKVNKSSRKIDKFDSADCKSQNGLHRAMWASFQFQVVCCWQQCLCHQQIRTKRVIPKMQTSPEL